ncbi:MAG: SDR family oxidoreductase [Candidatus Eremiobacteraeota bacterium]|nr:SDR family oxidoreductase [Candidatus Eremiobacteraeota bacterium]
MSLTIDSLFSVRGKTALVTGGSRGIGEMIARGLVENGARVYISSRKADVCEELARDLSAAGTCVALPADLANMDDAGRLAAAVAERESSLDILVNNAGAAWGEPFDAFSERGWDRVMDLNVKALFFLTQRLAPLLEKAGTADDPARVINIGSIDGLQAPVFEAYSYAASKAAVHQLTRHLAKHLAARHISVNAIAPGFFPSKMTEFMMENEPNFTEHIPLARGGTPEDMAGTVLFLASRAGAYLSGSVITVDGGLLAGSRSR